MARPEAPAEPASRARPEARAEPAAIRVSVGRGVSRAAAAVVSTVPPVRRRPVEVTVVPAERVQVRDTIGAGDSFSGGVIHALLRGADIAESVRIAADLTADWLAAREQETAAMTTEKSTL